MAAELKKLPMGIKNFRVAEVLTDDGIKTIRRYGIACYKKRCRVVSEPDK